MNKNEILIQFSKYFKIIFAIALVTAGGLVTYFVTYSNYKITKKFLLEITTQEKENSLLDARISQLDKIKRISSTIESTDILAKQAVPVEVEIPIVMSLVQTLTTDSGVKLEKLTYSGSFETNYAKSTDVVPDSVIEEAIPTNSAEPEVKNTTQNLAQSEGQVEKKVTDAIRIQGSVIGSHSQLLAFLRSVENSRRLLEISNVSYGDETSSEEKSSPRYNLSFVVSSFYRDFSLGYSSVPLEIDFDKYRNLISTLNNYKYTEIDLSKVNVGKNDPFLDPKKVNEVNSVETSDGLNGSADSPGINVVELEGTGSLPTDSESDNEASPTTNVSDTLINILKQEKVNY